MRAAALGKGHLVVATCGHSAVLTQHSCHSVGMTTSPLWRCLTPQDADAWAELFAMAEKHEPTGEHIGREELLEDLNDPCLPPEATAGAWCDGQMVAYVLVRAQDEADTVHRMHAEALVHPEHRNTRTAREVRDRIEGIAARVHAATFAHAEREVRIFVHEGQRWMADTLAVGGFHPARTFVDLSMDITEPVSSGPLPDGLTIVPYKSEYAEAARLTRNDAFAGHWGSTNLATDSWQRKTEVSTFCPDLSFLVLTSEKEVAALALASHYPAESREAGRDELYITDVGTRESWRRQGLAGALIRRMISAGYEKGFRGANIGVDHSNESGALRFYTALGFSPAQSWTVYLH